MTSVKAAGPRRLRTAVSIGLVLAALGSWAFLRQEPAEARTQKLPLQNQGVTVSRIDARHLFGRAAPRDGARLAGAPDDWVLRTEQLRLVVGSDSPGIERQLRYGAIIDLTAKDETADGLVDLRTVLQVMGRSQSLRTEGVVAESDGAAPFLRIKQRSVDGRLFIETDVKLERGRSYAELVTRIENTSDTGIQMARIGDRVRWPGAATFAPRMGFVKFSGQGDVPFIARPGRALTYALVFPAGHAEVDFLFDRVGSVAQVALSPGFDLAPGANAEYSRILIATSGGLANVAALAWPLTGKPIGRVRGRVEPAAEWASVDALHPDGRPVLSVMSDRKGRFELPLPAGRYRLLLKTPGGQYEQEVFVDADAQPLHVTMLAPEPGSLRYSVTDEQGAPLPARFIVQGQHGTPDPNLGPEETSRGAKNVFYSLGGTGNIQVPPGHYQITATHGPEYSVATDTVVVSTDTGGAVSLSLRRMVDTSGWIACDFHVHQAPSEDSNVSLEDRVISLAAEGVEFAVATDHNHVTDLAPSVERLRAEPMLTTATGIEITTPTWGHFIAFPYPKNNLIPPYAGVDPPEIFASVRARSPNAVIQVNHPRMRGIGYFNRIELDPEEGIAAAEGFSFDFDTLEVINGFELDDPKAFDRNLREWFSLLDYGHRYTAVGNSDSHRLVYHWAGYPRTYVRVNDDTPSAVRAEEVARSLLAGRAVVSGGAFVYALVNGRAGPGDLVTAERERVTLQVSVRAPDWIDIDRVEAYVNGVRVAEMPVPLLSRSGVAAQWETELALAEDSWLVVLARGSQPVKTVLSKTKAGPFGFTNPIFIDVDGDGLFRASGLRAPVPKR